MKSYAQDNEDLILYSLLHDVKEGKYIDVGANDPVDINVTKLFYDLGWSGINVEPIEYCLNRLKEQRTRDINLGIALGEKHDVGILYDCGSGSSFMKDLIPFTERELPPLEVEIYTMQEIYETYCKDWSDIHFCKIDVEGYEKNVLLGVKDWSKFRPWAFCIESTLPATSIPCYDEWEYILLENGYEFVLAHGINRYYVDKNRKGELDLTGLRNFA